MKEYFKPTVRKILGVIILLALSSFMAFFIQYTANVSSFISGELKVSIGWPLNYFSISGSGAIDSFNILYLIIDIIIFYLITCVLAIIFRGRKKENVPNSDSGGRDTSPTNQAQPGN
jgi:TRAP-type C4-dicarboxylate transport system permease small subunit